MTNKRLRELELDGNARLTTEERQQGWHFCEEWDFMCTQGEERWADGSCAYCEFNGKKVGDDGNYRN